MIPEGRVLEGVAACLAANLPGLAERICSSVVLALWVFKQDRGRRGERRKERWVRKQSISGEKTIKEQGQV